MTPEVKVGDVLRPLPLRQAELSGEIGRRVADLIRGDFMCWIWPRPTMTN